MALAEIGVFTGFAEAVATTIGAGMLIGGFIAGSIGTVRGLGRPELDQRVLASGYVGGNVVGVLGLIDLVLRYGG